MFRAFLALLIIFFALSVSSISFAGITIEGKLCIISTNSTDAIYLDDIMIGQGTVFIESLDEGGYQLKVMGSTGAVIYDQKVAVKAEETTTVNLKPVSEPEKQMESEVFAPAFSLYGGKYHFTLTGQNLPIVGSVDHQYFYSPNDFLLGVEFNRTVLNPLQIQLGITYFEWNVEAGGVNGKIQMVPVSLSVRYPFEGWGILKTVYVGGGVNGTFWGGTVTLPGAFSPALGYQGFIGFYLGSLQIEAGGMHMAGRSGGGDTVSAEGGYLKGGLAF
ncbi:MAG: hypothetical protein NT099_08560 [Candidatus Saganbacteria bacterium]|nr:hypothetical protein [Candidatus Saganbacteria bacterium]